MSHVPIAGRANLDVFADTLLELAQADRNVLAVTSDSRGSGKLTGFARALPQQLIEIGIAEQNLVGVAAGLAAVGKTVFAVSPACFLTARALEQVKNDVAYSDRAVALVGISAGVSYGALGSTHHSTHDLAVLRAIPNLTIIAPADNFETRAAVIAAAHSKHPVYLRFGKKNMPAALAQDATFSPGKAITLADGNVGTFIATGEAVLPAWQASQLLMAQGIHCRMISMHTLKPLDAQAVLDAATQTGGILTVEEHSLHGGLGEACAGVLMQAGARAPFRMVGIPDEFAVAGSQAEVFNHYGIAPQALAEAMRALLRGGAA